MKSLWNFYSFCTQFEIWNQKVFVSQLMNYTLIQKLMNIKNSKRKVVKTGQNVEVVSFVAVCTYTLTTTMNYDFFND